MTIKEIRILSGGKCGERERGGGFTCPELDLLTSHVFCINNRSLLYVSRFMSFIKSMSNNLLVFENIWVYQLYSTLVTSGNYVRHTDRCIVYRPLYHDLYLVASGTASLLFLI